MAQLSGQVGQKTRLPLVERKTSDESNRRKLPKIRALYLATHRCKVCDGKNCTGHCKF